MGVGACRGWEELTAEFLFLCCALIGELAEDRVKALTIDPMRVPASIKITGLGLIGYVTSIKEKRTAAGGGKINRRVPKSAKQLSSPRIIGEMLINRIQCR